MRGKEKTSPDMLSIGKIPSLNMGNIFVVNSLEDLENRLREVLRTPSSYPKTYPGILNEISKPACRDLDEAFETFQTPPKLRLRLSTIQSSSRLS